MKEDVKKRFSSLPPGRREPGDLHPVLHSPFLGGFFLFNRFGSPRIPAAIPAPGAGPDSSASCNGGLDVIRFPKLRKRSVGV